ALPASLSTVTETVAVAASPTVPQTCTPSDWPFTVPSLGPSVALPSGAEMATRRFASSTTHGWLVPMSPTSSIALPTIVFCPLDSAMVARPVASTGLGAPFPGVTSAQRFAGTARTLTWICTPGVLVSTSSLGATEPPQTPGGLAATTVTGGARVSTVIAEVAVDVPPFVTDAVQLA